MNKTKPISDDSFANDSTPAPSESSTNPFDTSASSIPTASEVKNIPDSTVQSNSNPILTTDDPFKTDSASQIKSNFSNIPSDDPFQNPPQQTTPDISSNTDSVVAPQAENKSSEVNSFETIVMSPHAPKKYGGKKIIATIFGIIFLVGSVAAGISLVQRQQMLSQKAASGSACSQSKDCVLLDDPGNKGQYTAPSTIDYVEISAGNAYHRFGQGKSSNECFLISIVDQTIQWEVVGQGAECKDISNIQVWIKQFDAEDTQWLIEQLCEGIELRVAGNHHSFEVFLDTSEDGNFWQEKQHWDFTDGELETYTLKYDTAPEINSFVRIRIMQFDQIIKELIGQTVDCSKISVSPTTPVESPSENVEAVCNPITIYNYQWSAIPSSELSSLTSGTKVYFTVSGTANVGEIEKAMFIVNQTELPETTIKKAGTDEFYSLYTIPENVTNFNITAKLYHSEIGWF